MAVMQQLRHHHRESQGQLGLDKGLKSSLAKSDTAPPVRDRLGTRIWFSTPKLSRGPEAIPGNSETSDDKLTETRVYQGTMLSLIEMDCPASAVLLYPMSRFRWLDGCSLTAKLAQLPLL
jgi:hypothetical protein